MLNWESLQSACLSCTRCPLSQTRHHVVFGVGPQDAEVLFVGEGPGENEDLQGEPFVGPAGKLLDDMLEIQTEITSMRGTSLVFTQRIVNAENTLLNEAEVLVVCVDPLKMKPRALPKSIVAEFKQ